MKKQIAVTATLSLILTCLSACTPSNNAPQLTSNTSDETINATEESSTAAETYEPQTVNEENPTATEETQAAEKNVYVYGEIEIPDIPSGEKDIEGTAGHLDDASSCLDSMVFETHTVGEYKISLVGYRIRTDKENYPGRIYAESLYVEVEKNGEKLSGKCPYNILFIYVPQYPEFWLFEDKIGTYIDLYELEQPVIAMRYYYDNNPARLVTKAVEFASLQNDEIRCAAGGVMERGTGVDFKSDPHESFCIDMLAPNKEDGVCYLSIFEADEFTISDSNTLVDEEAGIKYTFDFCAPSIGLNWSCILRKR